MPPITIVILVAIVGLALCIWNEENTIEGYGSGARRHILRHRRRNHYPYGPRPYGRRWYSYAPGAWAPVFVASGIASQVQSKESNYEKVDADSHEELNKSLKTILLGVAIVLGISLIMGMHRK